MNAERFAAQAGAFRRGALRVAEWSIATAETSRLSLQTRDGQTGNAHAPLLLAETVTASYVVVWSDGLVSRGTLERRQLEADLDRSLGAARDAAYDDEDAARVSGPATLPDVRLHDEAVASVAAGAAAPLLERLDVARRRVEEAGARTWSASVSATETRSRVTTSRGVDATGRATLLSWYVGVNGEIGCARSWRALEPVDDVESRVARVLRTARLLDVPAPRFEGGERPVLLHPDVVEELVLETLLHQISGSTIAHGEGWFGPDDLRTRAPVLREDLTLRVDPLLPMRSGSYRITAEGIPAGRCTYIESGRLERPVAGLKYARRLGIEPTPVPSGMDALFLEGPAPPIRLEEAWCQAEGGGLVLNVLGVHTLDAASGDFSLAAPQVLLIRDGRPVGRFRATLAGNLRSILRRDDLRLVSFDGEHTPGLLFPCRLDPK